MFDKAVVAPAVAVDVKPIKLAIAPGAVLEPVPPLESDKAVCRVKLVKLAVPPLMVAFPTVTLVNVALPLLMVTFEKVTFDSDGNEVIGLTMFAPSL